METNDTRCTAFEVKLADIIRDADVRHLLWLRGQLGARLADSVVLYAGPHAYRRTHGVAVVPLGP